MAEAALFRLMTWLSPAYPVGAFSYSHGLETAIEEGFVSDAPSLARWLEAILAHGAGRNDAILLAAAYRALEAGEEKIFEEALERALALPASAELRLETLQQGRAFLMATAKAWPSAVLERRLEEVPYPIAVAMAAAGHAVPLAATLAAYLHAFMANLVSAGVRLVPLGQSDGLRVLAGLEPLIHTIAAEAVGADLDSIASATLLGDWCAMRHETQHTRLFRS